MQYYLMGASATIALLSLVTTITLYFAQRKDQTRRNITQEKERLRRETPRVIIEECIFVDAHNLNYEFSEKTIVPGKSFELSNYRFFTCANSSPDKKQIETNNVLIINLSDTELTPDTTATKDLIVITKAKLRNIGGALRQIKIKSIDIYMDENGEIISYQPANEMAGDFFKFIDNNQSVELLFSYFISENDMVSRKFIDAENYFKAIEERKEKINENYLNIRLPYKCERYNKMIYRIQLTSQNGDVYNQIVVMQIIVNSGAARYVTWIEEE